MMLPKESRDLKKTYKRLVWFLVGVFIFDVFIAFLLFKYTNINQVLCGFIIIVISGILYLLFLAICAKIDKSRKQKLEEKGEKDPFTRK